MLLKVVELLARQVSSLKCHDLELVGENLGEIKTPYLIQGIFDGVSAVGGQEAGANIFEGQRW